MVGVLILSHGPLAGELLAAAGQISTCALEGFEALCLDWQDGQEEGRTKLAPVLAGLEEGHEGVLILVDMYGGTPCNVAMGFHRSGEVEVVAGVNLPMVVRLGCVEKPRRMPVAELAEWIRGKGRDGIVAHECSSTGC